MIRVFLVDDQKFSGREAERGLAVRDDPASCAVGQGQSGYVANGVHDDPFMAAPGGDLDD